MTLLRKRAIRKALEGPLKPALIAGQVCPLGDDDAAVRFPNLVLNTAALDEWVRFTVHINATRLLGIGQHPLTQDTGQAFAMVYTRLASGSDRNDTIAGIIEAAYPYNALLTFDGVSVIVSETLHGDGAEDGPWWASPVKIRWDVWRNL